MQQILDKQMSDSKIFWKLGQAIFTRNLDPKLTQKFILFLLQFLDEISEAWIEGALSERKIMLRRLHNIFDGIFLYIELQAAIGIEPIGELEHAGIFARLHQLFDVFFFDPLLHRAFRLDIFRKFLNEITGVRAKIKLNNFRCEHVGVLERIVQERRANDSGLVPI